MANFDIKFFPLSEPVDWSKIVVEKPVTSSFTKESSTISNCTSTVYYIEDGKKYKVLMEMAPQEILGVFQSHVMSRAKVEENLNGYQITYTIGTTTLEEIETKKRLDGIINASAEAMIKFCKEENDNEAAHDKEQTNKPESERTEYSSSLPASTRSQYTQAAKRKRSAQAVKSIYEFAKVKDEKSGQKVVDIRKPKVAYLKLMTKGQGDKLEVNTDIYSSNDELIDVKEITWTLGAGNTKRGIVHPVLLWDRVYFGQHGNTACGASNKIFIAEMNYDKYESHSAKIPRCLSRTVTKDLSLGSGSEEEL